MFDKDLETEEMSDQTEDVSPDIEDETAEEAPETAEGEPESEAETDPTKLPPELQKHYKGMQASYTKKMQALTEAVESLSPHRERLALFDKAIAGDPQARQRLAEIAAVNQMQPQQQSVDNEIPEAFETTKDLMQYLDKRFGETLKQTLSQIMPQMMGPVQEMQQKSQIAAAQAQIDGMRAKFKDFDSHVPAILKIREENPGITLENAYKLATYNRPPSQQQTVAKPGARPKAVSPKSDKPMSFEEAFELAKRQGR